MYTYTQLKNKTKTKQQTKQQAMQQSRVSVDPYKDEEEQITKRVEAHAKQAVLAVAEMLSN